jgi:hypothetical protein
VDKAAFEAEARRLVEAARSEGIVLRLVGALAFAHHCPRYRYLQEALGRHYTDIDFAAYGRDAERLRTLLARQGYREQPRVYIDSEGTRIVAEHPHTGLHLDVFLDRLEFCHTIPWAGRLECDDPTIPLAEMLLQTLWAAIQAEISAIDYDFWGWALERWERAEATFRSPVFLRWLEEAALGGGTALGGDAARDGDAALSGDASRGRDATR